MRLKSILLGLLCFALFSFVEKEPSETTFKCLIQITNYSGEGAYVVVSLINPEGKYEKTLLIQGDDEEWYPDLTGWWKQQKVKNEAIDGIAGATVGAGGRGVGSFKLDQEKIDSGYTLRFETAVEDQKYYQDDLVIPLEKASLNGKFAGNGYIRYVRLMASN